LDYKNAEGYNDPVPALAIANIQRQENRYRPLVYICSAFSGDVDGNTKKARQYCRFAVDRGVIPLAPHLLLPQFMDEQTERDLAMFMDMVFLGRCVELWVFGAEVRISDGMACEIAKAEQKNMKIRYFTEECKEGV
jgi:hypothetical protein